MTRNDMINLAADRYVHRWERRSGQSLDDHLDEALFWAQEKTDGELRNFLGLREEAPSSPVG